MGNNNMVYGHVQYYPTEEEMANMVDAIQQFRDTCTAIHEAVTRPLDVQVGGQHYKSLAIQPVEYIHANKLGYIEGNVIKYITRWNEKGGITDLEKAKHYIELLIELESKKLKEALE